MLISKISEMFEGSHIRLLRWDNVFKLLALLLIIYLLSPHRFACHYDYLTAKQITNALVTQISKNVSMPELEDCSYDAIIMENRFMYRYIYRDVVLRYEEILPGGEYYPEVCQPRYSTAIIVPYRQREEQLHKFLVYMHNYLRQQDIHYRIFLIEQYDQKPFNRAKLMNIGALIADQYDFPCLVLTDVDLLPLRLGNLYACTHLPRHMSSALDKWRFTLPYRQLMGGTVAISMKQMKLINGMSNMYYGWGGEDDDFYYRLISHNINICRFDPAISQYTMLKHKPQPKNAERMNLLKDAIPRSKIDGLNTVTFKEKERRVHTLFTHILAET